MRSVQQDKKQEQLASGNGEIWRRLAELLKRASQGSSTFGKDDVRVLKCQSNIGHAKEPRVNNTAILALVEATHKFTNLVMSGISKC